MSRVTPDPIHTRGRLAWSILLVSFAIFCAIAVAVPLIASAYLQNATEMLQVEVQANHGTVSITEENNLPRAALPGELPQPVGPGALILTDATASGLMLIHPDDASPLLMRVQLYSTTVIELEEATTPRFARSERSHHFALKLTSGRLRLVVNEDRQRPFQLTVNTPHGVISVQEPGEYSLSVNNEQTQVTVQQGQVVATAQGESLSLTTAERAEVRFNSAPLGPLPPERNLIENGSFQERWEAWRQYAWDVERSDQPEGSVQILDIFGETGLRIIRTGEGHAETGIRQVVEQDVTDYDALRLEVDLRILQQTLGVCGTVGSECPLIVRLEYEDLEGNAQVWQQGFFALGSINPETAPDVCLTCPPPRLEHVKVTPGQFSFYRTNLIEDLQLKGFLPPRRIKNVSIIASGHGFEAEVLDVALIAVEGTAAQ